MRNTEKWVTIRIVISDKWVFMLKQICHRFCTALPLTGAVSLVLEMRQTGTDVIEAVLFKEALWSSPCWYGRAAHHSSHRAYAHHMYISRQRCKQQQLCTQPLSSLYHPCAHTQSACAFGWRAHTHTHLRIHACTHSDIWYLCSLKMRVRHKLTNTPKHFLSAWLERSVKPKASSNSNIMVLKISCPELVVRHFQPQEHFPQAREPFLMKLRSFTCVSTAGTSFQCLAGS